MKKKKFSHKKAAKVLLFPAVLLLFIGWMVLCFEISKGDTLGLIPALGIPFLVLTGVAYVKEGLQ